MIALAAFLTGCNDDESSSENSTNENEPDTEEVAAETE